jgi:hypothetical protein
MQRSMLVGYDAGVVLDYNADTENIVRCKVKEWARSQEHVQVEG